MLRILIADDHEVVRRGLIHILKDGFPLALIDEATDTPTLVSKCINASWDIIISDLAMPGGGGLDALRQIREQAIVVPVLIISLYPEEQYALRVLKAGAAGYLNKSVAAEELVNAMKRVLSGRRYITTEVANRLSSSAGWASEWLPHELLNDKEFNVLKLMARGYSREAIAKELSLDDGVFNSCRTGILSKLNRKDDAELIAYAKTNNLT